MRPNTRRSKRHGAGCGCWCAPPIRTAGVKVKVLDISKRELARTLRKFRGNAWDQSPIFRRIYEEEFGQLGGEPYGLLVGDYAFDHRPDDVALLGDVARIAAAAHAPFRRRGGALAAADGKLGRGRQSARLDAHRSSRPNTYAWRALREEEDTRYIGLCMPRFLARLPYGAATDPLDAFAFEEDTEGTDVNRLLWGNAAFAFGANVVACVRDLWVVCAHPRRRSRRCRRGPAGAAPSDGRWRCRSSDRDRDLSQ